MITAAILTAALLAQASPAGAGAYAPASAERSDVAYKALARGDAEAALRKLERAGAEKSSDPATLINLAAAYIATGQTARAIASYKAAIATRDRYDLELANGNWADSRDVARQGLASLMQAVATR